MSCSSRSPRTMRREALLVVMLMMADYPSCCVLADGQSHHQANQPSSTLFPGVYNLSLSGDRRRIDSSAHQTAPRMHGARSMWQQQHEEQPSFTEPSLPPNRAPYSSTIENSERSSWVTESPGLPREQAEDSEFLHHQHPHMEEGIFQITDRSDENDLPPPLVGFDYNYDDSAAAAAAAAAEPPLPVIMYRYYSRHYQVSRTRSAGGFIPFILIGPNIDHWKVSAEELAARGFSVMACEQQQEEDSRHRVTSMKLRAESKETSARLILELLDALRWTKVVLVGCDKDSVMAIQAALQLAPDRVVGLVLCGNLRAAQAYVASQEQQPQHLKGNLAIDHFLKSRLKCPYAIIWDGEDASSSSSSISPVTHHHHHHHHHPYGTGSAFETSFSDSQESRYQILGGGSAPHRRRPELFAWVLTRFVEERIAPSAPLSDDRRAGRTRGGEQEQEFGQHPGSTAAVESSFFHLPDFVREIFSPGSFVVAGRIVAATLLYGMMLKVAFYQVDNIHSGVLNIKSCLNSLTSLRITIFAALSSFVANIGSFIRVLPQRDETDAVMEVDIESLSEEKAEKEEEEEEEAVDESASEKDGEAASENATGDTAQNDKEEEKTRQEQNEAGENREQRAPEKQFRPYFLLDNVIA